MNVDDMTVKQLQAIARRNDKMFADDWRIADSINAARENMAKTAVDESTTEISPIEIANAIAAGSYDGTARLIYDGRDPGNAGAFVRFDDGTDEPVNAIGWSNPAGVASDLSDCFDGDGAYCDDGNSVFPVFG